NQTSDDSDSQGGSDEEEAEAFNLLARNFGKGGESSKKKPKENKDFIIRVWIEGHFASECRKPKENKDFIIRAWSDSEDGDEQLNDATCLMVIDSQEIVSKPSSSNIDLNIIDLQKENEELLNKINDFEIEVKKLANGKEVVEPCKTCDELTKEVDSLKCNVSKLQDEALSFSKFEESNIVLDDLLSRQKLSQDKEGIGFSINAKTTSVCLKCDLIPDDWIMDSGCTKHMPGNRRLFTSYKAYDGGHVVFGSNLKGKVVYGGQLCDDDSVVSFTKVDCDISKNGKLLAKGHRRNGLYMWKLGDNSKQKNCLASVVDNSTLWHRRLGNANMRESRKRIFKKKSKKAKVIKMKKIQLEGLKLPKPQVVLQK
ncbi:hypothetical protein Tco_0631471, partial [Tanacetum coccineum]